MRYRLLMSVVVSACAMGAVAMAAPSARSDAGKNASPGAPRPPVTEVPCESGEPRDDAGACPVIDDGAATRGFTLVDHIPAKGEPMRAMPAVETASVPASIRDLVVIFRPGSADLTAQAKAEAASLARALVAPGGMALTLAIDGHADPSGSPARNKALARRRAEALKAYLVAKGVNSSRLQAAGYGGENLLDPSNPSGAMNRSAKARALQ